MTVIYHDIKYQRDFAFTKGSTESILDVCGYDIEGESLTDQRKSQITQLMNEFASEGLVLFDVILMLTISGW